MNGNHTIRRAFASVVAISAFLAMTSCSSEVSPPSQDINKVVKKDTKAPAQPKRTGSARLSFGDDLGTAKHLKKKTNPAGSGTRNRLNFGDDGL
jgi:hypothetical protein